MSTTKEKKDLESQESGEETPSGEEVVSFSPKTPIPIDESKMAFDVFLKKENNSRIFFSAPFGMGKTYFLEEFFAGRKEEYNVFHLYPVKYQVRGDVEMVEVVGADLFIRLYEDRDNIGSKKIIEDLLQDKDFKRKLKDTTGLLLKCLGSMVGVTPSIIDTARGFLKDEGAEEIWRNLTAIHLNFFEDLVGEILKKLKKESGKENVLILDDLDRFEPKHIFKLLNAFSPTNDREENKYGFDRVIFVGDIDNLRKVFHHFYGDIDFNGYIDKFFSFEPYRYEMEDEIKSVIGSIIREYSSESNPLKDSLELERQGCISTVLAFIVILAIRVKKINLRNILMPQRVPLSCINTDPNLRERNNAQVSISAAILLSLFRNDKEDLFDFIDTAKAKITDGSVSFSANEVLVLQQAGASMLSEIIRLARPIDLRRSHGGRFTEQEEARFDVYNEQFEPNEKESGDRSAQKFLDVLKEYIQKDVYKKNILSL